MKTIREHLADKNLDFLIEKMPVHYSTGATEKIVPDSYALVRSDNHGFLGLSKGMYTPVPNRFALSFIDELIDDDPSSTKAKLEAVEGFEGGKKLQVRLRFPETIDSTFHKIEKIVAVRTSHDLTEAISVSLVVRATDTSTGAVSNATLGTKELRLKHTKNVAVKLAMAQPALDLMDSFYLGIQEDFVALDQLAVPLEVAMQLIDVVAPEAKRGLAVANREVAINFLTSATTGGSITLLKAFLALSDYVNSGRRLKNKEMASWKACSKQSFLMTRQLFLKTKQLLKDETMFGG